MTAFVFFVRTSATGSGTGEQDFDNFGDTTPNGEQAFVSLSVGEAAIRGTTYSAGDTIVIKCSVGSGSAADTSTVTFLTGNWANPPDKITVITNDGVSATYDTGKYRIEHGTGYASGIRATVAADFEIDSLQFKVTGGASSIGIFAAGSSGFTYTVINNLLEETGGTNTSGIAFGVSGGIFEIANNVVFNFALYGLNKSAFMGTGTVACYNNTADGCGTNIRFISGGGTNTRLFNNIATNKVTNDYALASITTSDNNISSDATSPQTAHRNKTVTYAGTGDFQTSDADVVGLGTDLSADSLFAFSTDRLGVSRGANWDIGAFQDVAAPTGGDLLLTNRSIANYQGIRQ